MRTSGNSGAVKRTKDVGNTQGKAKNKGNLKVAGQRERAASEATEDKSSSASQGNSGEVSSALEYLDSAKAAFVEQVNDVANRVMALTPKKGALHTVGVFLSDRLLRTSTYLEERTTANVGTDAWKLVKKNYIPLVGAVVGTAAGVIVSRKIDSSSTRSTTESTGKRNSSRSGKSATSAAETTTH